MKLGTRTLMVYMDGEDVRELQYGLRLLEMLTDQQEIASGVFGPFTEEAVKKLQTSFRLSPSGIVKQDTVEALTKAIETRSPWKVTGTVTDTGSQSTEGLLVRAFDWQKKQQVLLGAGLCDNQGIYTIQYRPNQFGKEGKLQANVMVRIYSANDALLNESNLSVATKPSKTIHVKVTQPPQVTLTEYEQYVQALTPYSTIKELPSRSENDLKAVAIQSGVDLPRLQLLQLAAASSRDTTLPIAALYAWQRMLGPGVDLRKGIESVLTQSDKHLRGNLVDASTGDELIPALEDHAVNAIMQQVETLRIDRGLLVPVTVKGRLLKKGSQTGVSGYSIAALHALGDTERNLGFGVTDDQGYFTFTSLVAPDARSRGELKMTVLSHEQAELHTMDLAIPQDQIDAIAVEIPAALLPGPLVHPLKDLKTDVALPLSTQVINRLVRQDLGSLQDIRKAGGLYNLENLPSGLDTSSMNLLMAHTRLNAISPSNVANAKLIQKGYDSAAKIANTPRDHFIGEMAETNGELTSSHLQHLYFKAETYQRLVTQSFDEIILEAAKDPILGERELPDIIREVIPQECECQECNTAVSPRAYFTDLLRFTLEQVSNGDPRRIPRNSIDIGYLTNRSRQAFNLFLDNCAFGEQPVRQVRVCVEALQRAIADQSIARNAALHLARKHYDYRLAVYSGLLAQLGTSLQEIRASATLPSEERKRLAHRLGLWVAEDSAATSDDPLARLYLDPEIQTPQSSTAIPEQQLERLFGFVDTRSTRQELSNVLVVEDARQQIQRIELHGIAWKRNTDEEGLMYLSIEGRANAQRRVAIFKNADRTGLVAQGDFTEGQEDISLEPMNLSGLMGTVSLTNWANTNTISLRAISLVESWRLEFLSRAWQAQDWPDDVFEQQRFPIIDPDVIGPDDFRHTEDDNAAFKLWQERRKWVDDHLIKLRLVADMDTLLDQMYEAPNPTWKSETAKDQFEDLARLIVDPDVAIRTDAIDRMFLDLQVTVDAFTRLMELWQQDRRASQDPRLEPLTSDDWNEVYNILVQAKKNRQMTVWIEEETDGKVVLDAQSFWRALREPMVGEWGPHLGGDDLRPFIDPEILSQKDVLEHPAGYAARTQWQIRQQALQAQKQVLRDVLESQSSPAEAIAAMMTEAFGTISDLETFLATLEQDLSSLDPDTVQAAKTRLANQLFLDIETFAQLLKLKKRVESVSTPLREAEWGELLDMLTTAHKRRVRYPEWKEEERIGRNAIAYWQALKARLPKWRATAEQRQQWRQSLEHHTQVSIIDPDLLERRVATHNATTTLWGTRSRELRQQYREFQRARKAARNKHTWLTKTLEEVLEIDQPMAVLLQLKAAEEAGESITGHLHQLSLPRAAFNFLYPIVHLLNESATATILDSEWDAIVHILIQIGKVRQYGQWRREEQARGITLSPYFFTLPEREPFIFPPPEPEPKETWRTNDSALREWKETLAARQAQQEAIAQSMKEAVGVVEEATLPSLRDALIEVADASSVPLKVKAETMSNRLLLDMQDSGCRVTTRLGLAIETLQTFLWGLRTGELDREVYSDLKLKNAETFEKTWQWMGTYATWRAVMFVYIYPENLLLPSFKKEQTPAFRALVKETRTNRRFSPAQACQAAKRYSEYLTDVANLEIIATCTAATRLTHPESDCLVVDGIRQTKKPYVMHMFAQSTESRRVFWSIHRSERPFWEALPQFEEYQVVEIIGAVPYKISVQHRYLYIFVKVQDQQEQKLMYDRFNLNTGRWDQSVEELALALPEEVKEFTAKVKQTTVGTTPPQLAIRVTASGAIYIRTMNQQGNEWNENDDELIPIGQPGKDSGSINEWPWLKGHGRSNFGFLLADLLAFVEVENGAYLFAKDDIGYSYCRYFGARENIDGTWYKISRLLFLGVFQPYSSKLLYVLFQSGEGLMQVEIQAERVRSPKPFLPANIPDVSREYYSPEYKRGSYFDKWFYDRVGVSFEQLSDPINGQSMITRLGTQSINNDNDTDSAWFVETMKNFVDSDSTEARQWKSGIQLLRQLFHPTQDTSYILEWLYNLNLGPIAYPSRDENFEPKGNTIIKNVNRLSADSFLPGDATFHYDGRLPNIAWQGGSTDSGIWRTQISLDETKGLLVRPPDSFPLERVTPKPDVLTEIPIKLSQSRQEDRKQELIRAFDYSQGASWDLLDTVKEYLWEAYYFVPLHLAWQLQRNGHYVGALDLFLSVYDDGVPSHELDDRKVFPHLSIDEEGLELYRVWRFSDYDPFDVHTIARNRLGQSNLPGRPGAYTRFMLLSMVRCLLAYADSEFTLDTNESVAKACELYQRALDLLALKELRQQDSCEDVVARIVIELNLAILADDSSDEEIEEAQDAIVEKLRKLTDRGRVGSVEPLIRVILNGRGTIKNKLKKVEETVTNGRIVRPARRTGSFDSEAKQEQRHDWVVGESISGRRPGRLDPETIQNMTEEPVDYPNPDAPSPEPVAVAPRVPHYFCVPTNPVLDALRLHAELNLYKIRSCRNIAGMERQIDPYAAATDATTGLPQIGVGGNLVLPGTGNFQPTPYRYPVLLERAKQLVQFANQIEAAMLSAIQHRDAEAYSHLTAKQQVNMSRAGLRLQDLRSQEAKDGIVLSKLQRERAQIQFAHWQGLLAEGELFGEQIALGLMIGAAVSHAGAAVAHSFPNGSAAGVLSSTAAALSTTASVLQTFASYERRKQDWEFQAALGQQDIRIGSQQVKLAEDHLRVVGQERKIAELQMDHAKDVVEYLSNKFTNVELYDWMANVLEDVYGFFLQQATSMAKTAESQLAFERQEVPPAIIQADYWADPDDGLASLGEGNSPDRRGLTGSARLLQDIVQLDQYAFETNERKLQLTKTLSLAQLAPAEFQRFRETGVLLFATPMALFDQDFPGHYLRLIKRVRTSIVALVPVTDGIHATLTIQGLSRVVIGGDLFQTVPIRRAPESVALSSPRDASGLFELLPQSPELLLPFEGSGVATSWELRLPKASNHFDFGTIADVQVTIEYTALDSYAYRQQVIHELDRTISADRPFSFRHQFADQWYDLHNPDRTATPMTVRFTTRPEDFPPNLDALSVEHVLLYFARKDGVVKEIPITHFMFQEAGSAGAIGGGSVTVDGLISTRKSHGASWLAMIGKSPVGQWELALPNNGGLRARFQNEEFDDILLVITYRGQTPEWPA